VARSSLNRFEERFLMRRWLGSWVIAMAAISTVGWGQARRPRAEPAAAAVGALSGGWMGRVDPQEEKQGKSVADIRLDSVAAGLHLTAGPSAAFWHAGHEATGAFDVTATFTQLADPFSPASYGLFIGGSGLTGKTPNYLYCAIFGSGTFSIKHRLGGELHTLVERRVNGSIRKADPEGRAANQIAWKVSRTSASCVVNGTVAATFPRELLIGTGKLESTDGTYGLHVDRGVTLGVSPLVLTKP
jgi:hypothetical protein